MKLIQLARSGDYINYSETALTDREVLEILENIPDDAVSPHRMAEAKFEYDLMMACLTERQREYVELLLDGLSYHEIAEKMGVQYTYSKNMWQRIRDRLRAHGYGPAVCER